MPYNNNPIPKPTEFHGSANLPLARVKKIINADDSIHSCSNNAAFVITVAAEMFMHYLTEKTYDVVKSERKPRRNIQYKDVANAVARFDNLEFLTDVVPRTVTYKEYKQKQAKQTTGPTLANGQTTIDGKKTKVDPADDEGIDDDATEEDVEMEEASGVDIIPTDETKELAIRDHQGPPS
ncbi:hypothetical protein EV356DRAFT_572002 [Viridothelium virens]|uniref:Transcription factor CBF/NF-Y/archaeal histone domain-containing protein n=1 Tax=Viridothelium virens TaxID=1048519 RepID=A0A6A6HQ02_VIRVR|nr:hypothetical protein EV356DRAFT_572002 [Viridothelium virens]